MNKQKQIISASRRTDIPAYFSKWFYDRLHKGYCTVANPFNPKQISNVDLTPEAVNAIVFWTRNPAPMFKNLYLLNDYSYYFLYTLNNYPKLFERNRPDFKASIKHFKELADKIGNDKVIWRYDPVFFTKECDFAFHINNFSKICKELNGFTNKVITSRICLYRKTISAFKRIGIEIADNNNSDTFRNIFKFFSDYSQQYNIKVEICSDEQDYSDINVFPAKCIDEQLINKICNNDIEYTKDKSQRKHCNCTVSKDIGTNNTCLADCIYCYATSSYERAVENWKKGIYKYDNNIMNSILDNF